MNRPKPTAGGFYIKKTHETMKDTPQLAPNRPATVDVSSVKAGSNKGLAIRSSANSQVDHM